MSGLRTLKCNANSPTAGQIFQTSTFVVEKMVKGAMLSIGLTAVEGHFNTQTSVLPLKGVLSLRQVVRCLNCF